MNDRFLVGETLRLLDCLAVLVSLVLTGGDVGDGDTKRGVVVFQLDEGIEKVLMVDEISLSRSH